MVKIQEGCNQVCAYCIVPRVRGRERSVPQAQLVAQVEELVAQGFREVVLTGTQLGSYGCDRPGEDLASLIGALLRETAVERLRVSSLQPQEVTPSLLDLWRDPRLCPHFHIPLQSGSDAVLQRMRRRYDAAAFLRAVSLVCRHLPGAAVTTDVMVGFPGETEEDFAQTYALCREAPLARMHVFPFSPRPGTAAARLPHQVDAHTKEGRAQALLALARQKEEAFLRAQVGTTQEVLWEEVTAEGIWTGLTPNYARVFARSDDNLENAITPARITTYRQGRLWAQPLR